MSHSASVVFRSSFPDFRHQHNSWDALWLEDAPQRAAEAVQQLDMDPDCSGKVNTSLFIDPYSSLQGSHVAPCDKRQLSARSAV